VSGVAEHAPFSIGQIQRLIGLSRGVIQHLIDSGFVSPQRGARNEYRFSFREVVLLRTAHELRLAKVPARKILQALRRVREALPAEGTMSELRLSAVGTEVIVQQGDSRFVAISGQLLLDLDSAERGTVAELAVGGIDPPPAPTAKDWFARGEALEEADPLGAEAAYRAALEAEDDFADAYLNLGALLCEAGRCGEAVALYDEALRHCADEPLLHFNRAVALEDMGDMAAAASGYEAALTLNPHLADAHFNLARLQLELGQQQRALRHFNTYRRLLRLEGAE